MILGPTGPLEPRKVYKILTGNSEDEYYTFTAPKFKDDKFLVCTTVFIRMFVTRTILNKVIKVDYASKVIAEKEFPLNEGVVIKAIDEDKNMEWSLRIESDAEALLKDKELEVYREIIPKLLSQRQNMNDQIPTAGNKNLFI